MNILLLGTLISDLIPMGLVVALPILYVWLTQRNKQHETDKRSEIAMAIIEKNPDIDIQEFLNKLNPPKESYKEKMLKIMHYEVLWGTICFIGGIVTTSVIIAVSILQGFVEEFIFVHLSKICLSSCRPRESCFLIASSLFSVISAISFI